jgi:hypothetical protein
LELTYSCALNNGFFVNFKDTQTELVQNNLKSTPGAIDYIGGEYKLHFTGQDKTQLSLLGDQKQAPRLHARKEIKF